MIINQEYSVRSRNADDRCHRGMETMKVPVERSLRCRERRSLTRERKKIERPVQRQQFKSLGKEFKESIILDILKSRKFKRKRP